MTLASMTTLKSTGKVSMSAVAGGKIQVITEDSFVASSVLLTYTKNGGSASEVAGEAGAAAVNKYLTFKSSEAAGSAIRTLREMENAGVVSLAEAGHSSAKIGYSCAPDLALDFVKNLALDSVYAKWDVADAINYAKVEADVALADPENMLSEGLLLAAYGDASPMSNSMYYGDGGASRAGVMSFREREYYGGGDAVVAACGIADHDAFVAAVADAFEGYGSSSIEGASGEYRGGEYRLATASGKANVALGFAAPADPIVGDILKQCLAASGYTAFVNEGVIGVSGDSDAAGAGLLAESLADVLAAPVSAEQVATAKSMAKAEALLAMEASGCQSLVEQLTLSAVSGSPNDSQDITTIYDEVTPESVIAAASEMTKGNLSVSALGSIAAVPYQATLSTKFA